ncbi:MAG TPA: YggS family pyridoxal phosphate-dependent enzyme [Aggregatilineales bacterium]|nr:YggS family pyridoxal phosphate-dependent enzyme [Aggregatilineales bacterium]
MTDTVVRIGENLRQVQARIAEAAARAGRDPSEALLVGISKTHGIEVIQAAYEAGLRHFGENRVYEAEGKIREARTLLPADVVWHMVGHIQSRKARDAAPLFDWIHSVDRLKIARRLSDAATEGRPVRALLQVNISGEESKFGFDLSRWPEDEAQAEHFFAEVEQILALPGLEVQGLMTLAPYTDEPETVRPVFRRLRELRDVLRERFPGVEWPHLSMGMSGDYEVAVEEGATMVRVGTAIFGPRE